MMDFSIRLVICCNGCAVGPRLTRGAPFPAYQHSYDATDAGREQAEKDMAKIVKYMDDNKNAKGSRK